MVMGVVAPIPPKVNGSVVKEPPSGFGGPGMFGGDYVLYYSSVADTMPAWGTAPGERDRQLRSFWPTEPMLASAIYSTVTKYAAFGWQLKGPPRTVSLYERVLHGAQFGKGWIPFLTRVLIDYLTQDNGAFIETIRAEDSATSPVIGLNQLDANRCIRTGRTDYPVIYWDLWGKPHKMAWYQVIDLCEFPSPIENMRGMGYCAVTRCLRAAQIMKDISVYNREKISGRFTRRIYLVSGVTTKTINDGLAAHQTDADGQALSRFIQPLVMGSLDPNAKVSVESIDLASLPDGFDEEKSMRQYITQLALALGSDYQDFAPMQGGRSGSAGESSVMHVKSRGKGPRLFMRMLESIFRFHGVLPNNIEFTFGDQDVAEDLDNTKLRIMRAEERAMRIKSGEIDEAVARQIAVEFGDLDEKYLAELEGHVSAETEAMNNAAKIAEQQQAAENDPSNEVQAGKPTAQNTAPTSPTGSSGKPGKGT